jgi:hypothetical protein
MICHSFLDSRVIDGATVATIPIRAQEQCYREHSKADIARNDNPTSLVDGTDWVNSRRVFVLIRHAG